MYIMPLSKQSSSSKPSRYCKSQVQITRRTQLPKDISSQWHIPGARVVRKLSRQTLQNSSTEGNTINTSNLRGYWDCKHSSPIAASRLSSWWGKHNARNRNIHATHQAHAQPDVPSREGDRERKRAGKTVEGEAQRWESKDKKPKLRSY